MDYKDIEQLLERYWQCETSLEEESQLRDFFSKGEVPAHLLRYKNLFVYQQVQQEEGLGEDFDARILAQVEAPVVKAKHLTMVGRFMPLFKAAAVDASSLNSGPQLHSMIMIKSMETTVRTICLLDIQTPPCVLEIVV